MSLPNPSMSFSPFAILTAEEVNNLVENIEALSTGTGLADGAVTFAKTSGIWWEEIGRTSLIANGDTLSVTGIPYRKYLRIQFHVLSVGAAKAVIRFNNDSANNYAHRYSVTGAFGSAVSAPGIGSWNITSVPLSGNADVTNVASQVKVGQADGTFGDTNPATLPDYVKFWFKWVNASSAISRIDIVNIDVGDFGAGSELIVLGHN